MYGKHSLVSFDSSQLSRKTNQVFSEMDKSSFFFVQNCGACHPGGGLGETTAGVVSIMMKRPESLAQRLQGTRHSGMGITRPSAKGTRITGPPGKKAG